MKKIRITRNLNKFHNNEWSRLAKHIITSVDSDWEIRVDARALLPDDER